VNRVFFFPPFLNVAFTPGFRYFFFFLLGTSIKVSGDAGGRGHTCCIVLEQKFGM